MFQTGIRYQETVTMVTESCISCGVVFGLPSDLQKRLKSDKRTFYCPNGHAMIYRFSQDQQARYAAEKAKQEAEERLAQERIKAIQLEQQLNKVKKQMVRVHKGVCPCCNKSFVNLQRHMQTKHADVIK